ncbi:MAG: MerR family transcriptional regulator [candidate division KSB1 bacterium]|nr:MerR family transcriptional regulator [candidate division KSB1 bacterium]
MNGIPIKKLYYSIGEVSQLTSLEPYVLRYWETEFPELRPKKGKAGNRLYTLEDIRLVFLIKRLLYVDKYTIEGARQRLKKMRGSQQLELSLEELRRDDLLYEVKKTLEEILHKLEES